MTGEDEDAQAVARERERHLADLRHIPAERARLGQREHDLVRYARMIGITWDDIAAAIGTAADAALEQYGEPGPDEDPF